MSEQMGRQASIPLAAPIKRCKIVACGFHGLSACTPMRGDCRIRTKEKIRSKKEKDLLGPGIREQEQLNQNANG